MLFIATPSDARTPYLQIAPAMPPSGGKATVYGRGFCARAACSRIVLTLDGRWIARPFRPLNTGRFVKTILASRPPGPHTLRATQKTANGTRISASIRVIVGPPS